MAIAFIMNRLIFIELGNLYYCCHYPSPESKRSPFSIYIEKDINCNQKTLSNEAADCTSLKSHESDSVFRKFQQIQLINFEMLGDFSVIYFVV